MSQSNFGGVGSLVLKIIPYRVQALFRRQEQSKRAGPRVLVTYGPDDRIIFIRTSEGHKEVDSVK